MIGKLAALTFVLGAQMCIAQVPSGAPSNATGLCNDGTYFTGARKSGACKGHKGLKTWYGPQAAQATKTAKNMSSAKPATSTPPPTSTKAATNAPKTTQNRSTTPMSARTQASGGGPGLVWLNTASNVYHCSGSRYYGKTKAGTYMTEADAKAKGAHPEGGKPCK